MGQHLEFQSRGQRGKRMLVIFALLCPARFDPTDVDAFQALIPATRQPEYTSPAPAFNPPQPLPFSEGDLNLVLQRMMLAPGGGMNEGGMAGRPLQPARPAQPADAMTSGFH